MPNAYQLYKPNQKACKTARLQNSRNCCCWLFSPTHPVPLDVPLLKSNQSVAPRDSMPSPEPKPGDKGWLYRVLEPYYSRECAAAAPGWIHVLSHNTVFPKGYKTQGGIGHESFSWKDAIFGSEQLGASPAFLADLMVHPPPNLPSFSSWGTPGVENVMQAMLEGQISSGAAWPRKMVQEICNLYKASCLWTGGRCFPYRTCGRPIKYHRVIPCDS